MANALTKITPDIFKAVSIGFFNELEIIKEGSEGFALNPEAEPYLVKLKEYEQALEEISKVVKDRIFETGTAISPDFRGVEGERIKLQARKYGARFKYELNKRDDLEAFLKRKETYAVDGKKVDEYIKKVGELPDGVYEAERATQVSIKLKDTGEETTPII